MKDFIQIKTDISNIYLGSKGKKSDIFNSKMIVTKIKKILRDISLYNYIIKFITLIKQMFFYKGEKDFVNTAVWQCLNLKMEIGDCFEVIEIKIMKPRNHVGGFL